MSGGEWLIRHRPADNNTPGYQTERVTIETDTAGGSWPRESFGADHPGLVFEYQDGRILIYPWANIVSAEYRPHTEP